MKRLIIVGVAAVALLAAATTILRSHSLSTNHTAGTTGTASQQKQFGSADVNKLPVEEFEDMSLVYSTAPKR